MMNASGIPLHVSVQRGKYFCNWENVTNLIAEDYGSRSHQCVMKFEGDEDKVGHDDTLII